MWISLSIGTGSGRAVTPALRRAERMGKPDRPILAYAAWVGGGCPVLAVRSKGGGRIPAEPHAESNPPCGGACATSRTPWLDQSRTLQLARSIGKREVIDYAISRKLPIPTYVGRIPFRMRLGRKSGGGDDRESVQRA